MLSVFREVILQNELGGDLSLVYQFSDADGVRTGKSGYSFGLCQFDTQNSSVGRTALLQVGFLPEEMLGICHQEIDIEPMNAKLYAAREAVDSWDNSQLKLCLSHTTGVCAGSGIELAENALLHIADYHNQMYLSVQGPLHRHLQELRRPVTAEDIRDFKLEHTRWGKKRADDVLRRYDNIKKLTT